MQLIYIQDLRNFLDLSDDRELIADDPKGFKVIVFFNEKHDPAKWLNSKAYSKEFKNVIFDNCTKVTYSKKEVKIYVETEDYTHGFDEAKVKSVVVKTHSEIITDFKNSITK